MNRDAGTDALRRQPLAPSNENRTPVSVRGLDPTPKLEAVLAPPDHLRADERISVDFPVDHDDRHKHMDHVLAAAKSGNEPGVLLWGHGPAPNAPRHIGIAVADRPENIVSTAETTTRTRSAD